MLGATPESEGLAKDHFWFGRRQSGGRVRGEVPRVGGCQRSMRYLAFMRALKRIEGRHLVPLRADVTIHSDAVDVGNGGTLI